MWRAPRSPTPDSFLPSPRKKAVKRMTDVLSPLVVGCRYKSDSNDNGSGGGDPGQQSGSDERESLLSDVQEEEETAAAAAARDDEFSDGYGKLSQRRRSNSMSLPDLRTRVCLVSGGITPPSSCTPSSSSSSDEAMIARYERRQHTGDEQSLPQLSEEEEDERDAEDEDAEDGDEYDEEERAITDRLAQKKTVATGRRKRNNSLSLPDLTRVNASRRVTVLKKPNGTYVTAIKRRDDDGSGGAASEDEYMREDEEVDGMVPRLRLPQLNITYKLCLSQTAAPSARETRSGFHGNLSVLRTGGKASHNGIGGTSDGVLSTDTVLKLTGSKVHSPVASPRRKEQPY